jgi:DNA replication protein DnaC
MEPIKGILNRIGADTLKGSMDRSSSADAAASGRPAEPVCPICGGAGYLVHDAPPGHPDFNRLVPCRCKMDELESRRRDELHQMSNLGQLSRMTFDTFMPEGFALPEEKRRNLRSAFEAARDFARDPQGWLILMGTYGCGKTHLAGAIANEVVARGEPVLFVVVPDLLDHLRATFGPNSPVSFDERFESVRNARLLILDDLGAQATSPWAQEKLFQILNHRYNAQLPTVLTTNLALEDFEPRLRSRVSDSDAVRIVGILAGDYRQSGQAGHESVQDSLNSIAQVADMTFGSFGARRGELSSQEVENLENALVLARSFAEQPEGWLVFTGDHGTGKTHLAAAIANDRLTRGQPAIFVTVPDLLDYLRAAFGPNSQTSFDKRFDEVRRAPLLILDDLGTESATPWAREKLYQIVNYRYNMRLATVFTTADPIEKVEPRLRSRMVVQSRCAVFALLAPAFAGVGRQSDSTRRRGRPRPAQR